MKGIILIGHGNFASGLTSSLKLLAGEPNNFLYHDYIEGMSQENLKEEIIKSVKQLNKCNEIVLATDILGGTPFKVSALLSLNNTKIEVITGINLPLLLTLALSIEDETKKITTLLDEIIIESKNAISRVDKSELTV